MIDIKTVRFGDSEVYYTELRPTKVPKRIKGKTAMVVKKGSYIVEKSSNGHKFSHKLPVLDPIQLRAFGGITYTLVSGEEIDGWEYAVQRGLVKPFRKDV